jgi:hypothetical protein
MLLTVSNDHIFFTFLPSCGYEAVALDTVPCLAGRFVDKEGVYYHFLLGLRNFLCDQPQTELDCFW